MPAGTVIANIPAGVVQATATALSNQASTSLDNVVTYTGPPLTVTINKAAGQEDPTNWPIFFFTVHFSEAVTGFVAADAVVVASAGATSKLLTGSGANYTLRVEYFAIGGAGFGDLSGTITATIPAAVCTGAVSGQANLASTSTDNVIAYTRDFDLVAHNTLATGSPNFMHMTMGGTHLYVAENANRLISVSVATPASPTVTQTLTPITGGSFNAINPGGVDVEGSVAYLSSVSQLRTLDVSNPAAMTVTGTTATESTRLDRGGVTVYDGGYAYVANFTSNRVTVVDVDPVGTPAVVGTVTHATDLLAPRALVKIGNHVITRTDNGLTSVSVSTPSTPTIVDTVALASGTFSNGCLLIMGSLLLVASNQLQIFDASDPTNLTLITAFQLPGITTNFTTTDAVLLAQWDTDVVVVLGGSASMFLVDISTPATPVVISATPWVYPPSGGNRIIADPPYVYRLHQTSGLDVMQYVGP